MCQMIVGGVRIPRGQTTPTQIRGNDFVTLTHVRRESREIPIVTREPRQTQHR